MHITCIASRYIYTQYMQKERARERERERERETGRGAVEIGGARDGGYNGSGNVLQDSALRVRRRVLHKEHTRVSCRKFVCTQDARRMHAARGSGAEMKQWKVRRRQ